MSKTKKIVAVLAVALVLLFLIGGVLIYSSTRKSDPSFDCEQICADSNSVFKLTGFNSTLWEERANASLVTHEKVELLRRVINTRCKLEVTLCIEKAKQISLIQKRDALLKRNKEAGL